MFLSELQLAVITGALVTLKQRHWLPTNFDGHILQREQTYD